MSAFSFGSGYSKSIITRNRDVAATIAILRIQPHLRATAGQDFNKPVEIVFTFVERFHQNPLVLSVRPDVVYVTREPGMAVRWDASVSQVTSISGTGAHCRKQDS